MNSIEIKSNFHHLIDSIQNDFLLKKFYELLLKSKNMEGKLWNKLSDIERKELLESYDESFEEDKHLEHKEVANKYKKWL